VLSLSRHVDEWKPLSLGKAMNRIKNMAAASAFSRWAELRADARKARHVMRKIVLYRAAKAFEKWKGLAEEKARLRWGLMDSARHVIGCCLSQETRVQHVFGTDG